LGQGPSCKANPDTPNNYGTQCFTTMFVNVQHSLLPWTLSIHSTSYQKIYFR